jgi:DNA/RNA endonuclease G (NUC1)
MHDSFLLTNVSPQVGAGFNRDYWARLEAFVRATARRSPGDTFVCTGPLFLPRHVDGASGSGADAAVAAAAAAVAAGAGAPAPRWAYAHAALGQAPRGLAVPTHFFKGVVTCGADGRASAAAAFVLPNARVAADARLTDFAVPLSALEAAAGLRFFRDLVGDDAKLALDAAAEPALARNAARLLMAPPPPLFPHAGALALARGAPAAPRHLCSLVECALPAEKWFERSGGGQGGAVSAAH